MANFLGETHQTPFKAIAGYTISTNALMGALLEKRISSNTGYIDRRYYLVVPYVRMFI